MPGRPSDLSLHGGNEDRHPCPSPSKVQNIVKTEPEVHYSDGERRKFESHTGSKQEDRHCEMCFYISGL